MSFRHSIKFNYITSLIKSLWLLGIVDSSRAYFWKSIISTLFRYPRFFWLSISYSIYRMHFGSLSQRIQKLPVNIQADAVCRKD